MAEKTLIARVAPEEGTPDVLRVTSPVVGFADGVPRAGTFLNAFDKLLGMHILNERYVLRLPRDVRGRVVEACIPDAFTPVEFGTCLVRLGTRATDGEAELQDAAADSRAGTTAAGRDGIVVASPSVGLFYRRPSPDAEPFVVEGSAVTTGSILGLVEVMKCFNQITFEGAGLPERGTVVEILAADGAEVQFGQPLFVIRTG